LQHGPGERQGNVDRTPPCRERKEEVQTRQQGQIYLQNVPAGRFSNFDFEKPSSFETMSKSYSCDIIFMTIPV
jgi:hypothetical protein